MGDFFTDSQRIMPLAEHAGPLGGKQTQVLDSFQIRRENAHRCDAHCAAGIATITNYNGAAPAAELGSYVLKALMYNVKAPIPDYVDDEYHRLSTIRLPAFAGMQITNGPYGAVSEPGPSTGETHACANKELDPEQYRAVISWVIKHDSQIRSLLFPALVEQYREMRDFSQAALRHAPAAIN